VCVCVCVCVLKDGWKEGRELLSMEVPTRINGWAPARVDGVQVRAADATVRDENLHILFSESAWGVSEWLELALGLVRRKSSELGGVTH